jgi:hypothetical protein
MVIFNFSIPTLHFLFKNLSMLSKSIWFCDNDETLHIHVVSYFLKVKI